MVNTPIVDGSSPVRMRVAVPEAAATWCWLQNLQHPKIVCSLRVSNIVCCSHDATVLQGLSARGLCGSVCSLYSIAGMMGTLLVTRSSATVGGSSDEVGSSSDFSVSGSLSVSGSEQGSVVVVATDLVPSSGDFFGIGGLSCLSLVDWNALGEA